VLHATQELVSLGLAKPILMGRPSVIEMRIQKLGLQIKPALTLRSSITNPIRALKSTGASTTS
jgi:phosphotransacetylase